MLTVSKQTDISNVKWSPVQITRFLKLLKNYQILWRLTDKDRKNKRNRDAAFQSLLAEAREYVGPRDLDMITMKSKMKNLKTVYTRERGKVVNANTVGETYTPGLRWYSVADSFLRHCKEEDEVNLETVDLHEILTDELNHGSPSGTDTDCEILDSSDGRLTQEKEPSHISFDIDSSGNVNLISAEKHNAIRRAILSSSRNWTPSRDHPNPKSVRSKNNSSSSEDLKTLRGSFDPEDKYFAFGMYVAAELRQLNDDTQLKLAKHYINSILFDASMSALLPP